MIHQLKTSNRDYTVRQSNSIFFFLHDLLFFLSHISLAGMQYCGLVFMFDQNLLMLLLRTEHHMDHILEIKELSEGEVISSVTTSDGFWPSHSLQCVNVNTVVRRSLGCEQHMTSCLWRLVSAAASNSEFHFTRGWEPGVTLQKISAASCPVHRKNIEELLTTTF